MTAVDVSRKTNGVVLPTEVSDEIWGKTLKESAIMAASRQITLPGPGVTVQTITGDVTAKWVDETEEKPVDRPTFGAKKMTPYTLAVIVPFSNQFRRDTPALYGELVRRLPYALATEFDKTVMGETAKPGDNFDTLADAEVMKVGDKTTYKDLVAIYSKIAGNDAKVSAWLAAPEFQAKLMAATDTAGRPLFVPDTLGTGEIGRFLGRPIMDAPRVTDCIGVAGDFASAASYGIVEGVSIDISTESSLKDTDGKTLNLWQRNMFAVRAEIEIGFRIRDIKSFVRIQDGATTPASR
ncbi:phage major capsid protein [Actinotignum schaalii]|uniref:phage major capsid protein n=1 Tax=Actinotignum TaxID=1653174 RepID=UPI00237EDA71|nr:phage major capsid protein [Actinotignum sanguinis]MDE1552225.1 phage major capsid protein [Actinotignum sanguinis]